MEEDAHCLDLQVIPTSTAAQQQSVAIDMYIANLQKLSSLREERNKTETQAEVAEQVLTLAAVNHSATFTTTPALVEAMVEEATKLRNELRDLVRSRTSPNEDLSAHHSITSTRQIYIRPGSSHK